MGKNEKIECPPIGKYIHDSLVLLRIEDHDGLFSEAYNYSSEDIFENSDIFHIMMENSSPRSYSSSRQARITCSSGYGPMKRFVEGSQI